MTVMHPVVVMLLNQAYDSLCQDDSMHMTSARGSMDPKNNCQHAQLIRPHQQQWRQQASRARDQYLLQTQLQHTQEAVATDCGYVTTHTWRKQRLQFLQAVLAPLQQCVKLQGSNWQDLLLCLLVLRTDLLSILYRYLDGTTAIRQTYGAVE